ncbi:metallophosphoesterase family protein [Brevibacterium spongiae]|uniref:Metallophosphoesterase n=1 Tax=Brevibacterium spongiae TaxID=2909672 RepID=A0ABY5SRJ3_9MICO|nr:metallophosphoesterase [Brevibacterium spongiae]UVI37167.1 metallophosphoesterase [Brevibacterium spongiae]
MSPRRRTITLIITLAVVGLLTLPWALFTSRADLTFGPHEAQYQITADSRLTVDFGPLGKLLVPAEDFIPLGLGLQVSIGEIPVSGDASDEQRPAADPGDVEDPGGGAVDTLGGDIASYATLFSAPQAQIDQVIQGLSQEILTRWALAICVITGGLVGFAVFLGPQRMSAVSRAFVGKELLGIGLVVVFVLTGLGTVVLNRPKPISADPAFDGTPLAGSQVTGRLGGIIDTAFTAVQDFADDNDAFYDQVLHTLRAEWNDRPISGNWTDQGLVPPAGAGDSGGDGGAASGEDRGVTTFVFASDIHCNVGMARVVGEVAAMSRADAYIDGGDISMTGTSAENYCLDVLDDELPDTLPRMIVKGNHDSMETTRHAKSAGWKVLEDSTAELGGVTFFGAADPRRTVFGSGPQLETELTADQYAQRLRDEACAADFDIMLIHDPAVGAPALRSGCADYALSGHWHRRVGPETFGSGVRYVSSTTGGALPNALTPGPLRMDAELSIIRVDNRTKRPIDMQLITVNPEREVRIDPWVRFPRPLPLAAQPPTEETSG